MIFDGSAYFEKLKKLEEISSFDFQRAIFKKAFVLEGEFHTVPNLLRIKTAHHLDLSKIKIVKTLQKNKEYSQNDFAENAACLRRLKEISENNRHHDAGLHFFERESQMMRASGEWGKPLIILDHLYFWRSDLKCSLSVLRLRPVVVMISAIVTRPCCLA